ncbi:MAG: phage portal protein [Pseudohongiellaceae bacterium]
MTLWTGLTGWWRRRSASPLEALLRGGGQTAAGVSVSPQTALRQATVGACIRVLSETIASLPLVLYRSRADGGRDEAADHPLHTLLRRRPAKWLTAFQLHEGMAVNLLTRGNGYCWIERHRSGELLNLIPLDPEGVSIEQAADYGPAYTVTMPDGEQRALPRDELHHVGGPLPKGFEGQSMISLYRETIGSALAGEQFMGRMWKNAATPSGVLSHPGQLSSQALVNLRESFERAYAGSANAGRPMVLEEGMSWVQMSLAPRDAQFVEAMKLRRSEIAAIFRVPPHLVGDLERATFSNIEQQSLEYVIYSLRPWLKRIEQAIWRDLLTDQEREAGYVAKFNVNALLRGDFRSRMEGYAMGRQWGWLSSNEVRAMEGLNPREGGADYLSPLNMTTEITDRPPVED